MKPNLLSHINIEIDYDKATIEKLLESNLSNTKLIEQEVAMLGRKYLLKGIVRGEPVVRLDAHILLEIPMEISVYEHEFGTFFRGGLHLMVEGRVELNSNWSLDIQEYSYSYEWIQRPRMSLGGQKVSVRWLVDRIIDFKEADLIASIRSQLLDEQFVREKLDPYWNTALSPREIVDDTWISVLPTKLVMTPLTDLLNLCQGYCQLEAIVNVSGRSSAPPYEKSELLPITFSNERIREDTQINGLVALQWDWILRFLNKQLEEVKIRQLGYEMGIALEAIHADQDGVLSCKARLFGGFKGRVTLIGELQHDVQSSVLKIVILDLQISMDSSILNAGVGVFKRQVRNEVERRLTIDIRSVLDELKETTNRQMAAFETFGPNLMADLSLQDIEADSFIVREEGLRFVARIKAKARIMCGRREGRA